MPDNGTMFIVAKIATQWSACVHISRKRACTSAVLAAVVRSNLTSAVEKNRTCSAVDYPEIAATSHDAGSRGRHDFTTRPWLDS
jgi:hypothetical protein